MTTTTENETTADRFRRLSATLTTRVDAVPADRWDSSSPCEGWTARDVLRHIVDSQAGFVKNVDLEIPAGPSVDENPSAAWQHNRDALQGFLDDPAKANREYEGGFGKAVFADSVRAYFCFDLIVHGWDIARATGIDETIPPEDLVLMAEFGEQAGPMLRSPGVCGPELEAPADADKQTRLLRFFGREA
ncbi:TIGR03086 family metal-binding protein [Antrihabitans sp. YC2-6]|uniref:TIGR03086 family metal-binding protein n=1 Tax=Antrihabitans sp. YC2-6 TaxID=2799498 RepID=UPI0018F521A4|nr:TIGR03086 family metal-binding protein [Antrihabitans sp. YC2-6]MBJ8346140.1 TIGR03086 family protein [Antrihabitans sp. YC2-6]